MFFSLDLDVYKRQAFYFAMMQTHSQLPAILLLFAFAFSMAGMNPTAVALSLIHI